MLIKSNLDTLKEIIRSEKQIVDEYGVLLKSTSEPQLKTEIQKIVSSHNNHIKKIISLLQAKREYLSKHGGTNENIG